MIEEKPQGYFDCGRKEPTSVLLCVANPGSSDVSSNPRRGNDSDTVPLGYCALAFLHVSPRGAQRGLSRLEGFCDRTESTKGPRWEVFDFGLCDWTESKQR